jgi:uncharacterized protein DUF1189
MKRFCILHPLLLSFYSPALYRDVAGSWTGVGILYLLLLLALCWIPPMVKLHRSTAAFLDVIGPSVLDQIPTVSIHRGEVSIQEPQPYVIKVPGSDTPLVVIDTTGQTTAESSRAMLLLTKHQAVVRKNDFETRTYELTGIQDLTVDKNTVGRILDTGKKWLALLLYPLALAGSYAYRILQVLMYAAIGLLFGELLKARQEYPVMLRVSCVAITPAVVVDTLRGVLGYESSLSWLSFCFLLSMGYLFFAVRSTLAERPARPSTPAEAAIL